MKRTIDNRPGFCYERRRMFNCISFLLHDRTGAKLLKNILRKSKPKRTKKTQSDGRKPGNAGGRSPAVTTP